ncbi:unknown [Prevotella sp. CAG:592]|nr:unknown [Prevotella sp. CAG:592]
MKKCILPNTLQRYNLLCPHTIVWASFLMYLLISLTYIKEYNIKSFTFYFILTFCNICFDMRDKTTKIKKRVKH